MNDNTPKKQIMHKAQVSQGFQMLQDKLPQIDSFVCVSVVNSGKVDENGDALFTNAIISGGCNLWERLGMLIVAEDMTRDEFTEAK